MALIGVDISGVFPSQASLNTSECISICAPFKSLLFFGQVLSRFSS